MKNKLQLPEWAFLDADYFDDNKLKDRNVVVHIPSRAIIEFVYSEKNVSDGFAFRYLNFTGGEEFYSVHILYPPTDGIDLSDLIDKAKDWFIQYLRWEDSGIIDETMSMN